MSLKEIKEKTEKDYPAAKIVGFSELQANDFRLTGEINNQYIALLAQYEQAKKNIIAIEEILEGFENGKVPITSLIVPFGNGFLRNAQADEKDDIITKYKQALEQEKVKLAGMLGQLSHKGDALGEQRMRILHGITIVLTDQHNFTFNDLMQQMGKWYNAEIIVKTKEPVVQDVVKTVVTQIKEKQIDA